MRVTLSFGDVAAGDGADLGNAERVADFGRAEPRFLDDGLQHAGHGALNLVDDVVDDGVETDVHLFAVGQFSGLAFGSAR